MDRHLNIAEKARAAQAMVTMNDGLDSKVLFAHIPEMPGSTSVLQCRPFIMWLTCQHHDGSSSNPNLTILVLFLLLVWPKHGITSEL